MELCSAYFDGKLSFQSKNNKNNSDKNNSDKYKYCTNKNKIKSLRECKTSVKTWVHVYDLRLEVGKQWIDLSGDEAMFLISNIRLIPPR